VIELVSAELVAADDARLGWAGSAGPQPSPARWANLAQQLGQAEPALRDLFKTAPAELNGLARTHSPMASLRFAACLADTLLDATLDFARVRKSQGKVLLTYQAVALRVANLYLALIGIEQAIDDASCAANAAEPSPERLCHAADLLLAVLRNAAQVQAGHGFVDNERFAALHQAALDAARDLHTGAQHE
jgi:alkylation response protein AidB-like acyl-CoA dehydrogenase